MSLPAIDLPVFHENGFQRKKCRITGLWFWTTDSDRETCGDTFEDEYTFIGEPLIPSFPQRGKALKDAMRESFLTFFESYQHQRVEPYPVLARWRDDIHLTIASIADFQPHVTSGQSEPPANPLTISQPCIRLTDVDAVGRSGRHLTTFEMMAHHVFNRPDDGQVIYWTDQCVRYCHELFTHKLGIDGNQITYVENPWCGGGNAGNALEVIVGGLELATLVFMDLEEDPQGEIELKGDRYSTMPLQIIDTGYGLERFCWAAAGTPTIYEAIYPESVQWLKELSNFPRVLEHWPDLQLDLILSELSRLNGIMNIEIGTDAEVLQSMILEKLAERGVHLTSKQYVSITEPLSRIYAIPDHMHAISHMLGDGLVPSNAKAGYLARMLARRVLRMRDDLGLTVSLRELGVHHLECNLAGEVQKQTHDGILHILDLEETRYEEMMRKGSQVMLTMLRELSKDATIIPDEILFQLNDSHGIPPDIAITLASKLGWSHVQLRTGFNAEMAERHAKLAKQASLQESSTKRLDLDGIQSTEPLFYDDVYCVEFNSKVLKSIVLESGFHSTASHCIILESTLFYPEGGGQESDRGHLTQSGSRIEVLDVQKQGEIILHFTNGPVDEHQEISGAISWERRKQLMDHHTSVHIVGGAARILLGPHIFQAGANKSEEMARLDITHYGRLSREQLDEIEDLANRAMKEIDETQKTILSRKDADATHGFDLYQGGAPKGDVIRVLKIGEHDTQACGGTHHDYPGQIGLIRIVRSTAVQDGVERLHIVAGEAARKHLRQQEKLLSQTSDIFGIQSSELPKTADRFFKEWKEQKKRIEQLEAEIVRLRTSGGGDATSSIDGVRCVVMETDGDLKQMTTMLKELTLDSTTPTLAILASSNGGPKLMVALTENSIASERYNAVEILKVMTPHIKGGGGGKPTFAQAGGADATGLPNALKAGKLFLGLGE
ncbi:MAG: alanine--tRNA ligase [archaeon]|nr:alanine--tRNA ligase [archaeon]